MDQIEDFSVEGDEAELNAFKQTLDAARARDEQARFATTAAPPAAEPSQPQEGGTGGFSPVASSLQSAGEALADSPFGKVARATEATVDYVTKLPKNIGLGLMDAGVYAVNTAFDALDLVGEAHVIPEDSNLPDPSNRGLTMREGQVARRRADSDLEPEVQFSKLYADWRSEINSDADLADTLTQGAAQFMVPFAAFSKAYGVSKSAGLVSNALRLGAADVTTSALALDPHGGRAADLIKLGTQAEGKFGELMAAAVPDGSLQNQYIEWMTSHENEGEFEGRFKNAVDGLTVSAALAGIFKAAGSTFKAARKAVEKVAGRQPVKPAAVPVQGGVEEQHSGLVFKDEKEAQELVEELAHRFGPGFEQRAAAAWDKSSDKNFATLHSFAQVLKANVDKPVSTHSLVVALERNIKGDTETGAFYKELLGRLKAKNLGGMVTVRGELRDPGNATRGTYSPASNAVTLYPTAFVNGPGKLLQTFTHEAVHAATVRAVRESPEASAKITRLFKRIEMDLTAKAEAEAPADQFTVGTSVAGGKQHYGMTNPDEFIAEIEANPEFRKLMKDTKIDGESAWDKYKKAMGGILGIGALAMSPEFDKLMDPKQEEGEE